MSTALFSTANMGRLAAWATSRVLTDTCDIQREVNSAWVTQLTVPCALIGDAFTGPLPDEMLDAELKTVLMPRLTDVRTPDRLLINSILYRVFKLKDPSTYEVLRIVTAVRFPQRGGA